MKDQILKIAKVKDEKSFYKKFPTEEAFMAKHGKQLKKAAMGSKMVQTQLKQLTDFGNPPIAQNGSVVNHNTGMFQMPMNGKSVSQFDTMSAGYGSSAPPEGFGGGKSAGGFDSAAAGMAGIQGIGQIIGGINAIGEQRKSQKRAERANKISGLTAQAASTKDVQKNKYIRPEDMLIQPGQMGSPTGVDTNYLAANGAEIQNTYAPNTLYTDLGYEPLNDSNPKQYRHGGNLPTAEFGEYFQDSGEAQIGSAVGGAIAAGFGLPPELGQLVGKVGGNLFGGVKNARKLQAQKDQTALNQNQAAWSSTLQSGQFNKFMEDGGWVSNDWQPQVITTFGEHKVKDLLKPPYDADMLRAGGHLKEYTPPSARALQTYEYGGQMAMGGELQVGEGGYAEPISYNPYMPGTGETVMFRGRSHDDGGIPIQYGQNGVEVEGGEPMFQMEEGGQVNNTSGVVAGNMKIDKFAAEHIEDPKANGKKYKHYIADLSKVENKQNKIIDKSTQLAIESDANSPFDQLSLNSSQANIMGANMKLKETAMKKMNAAAVQNAILDTAKELGVKSDRLAEGKIEKEKDPRMMAKNGTNMKIAEGGFDISKMKNSTDKGNVTKTSSNGKKKYISNGKKKYIEQLYNSSPIVKYATDYNLPSGFTPGVSALPAGMGGLKNNFAQALEQVYPLKNNQSSIDIPFQPGYVSPAKVSAVNPTEALSTDQIDTGKGKFDWKGLGEMALSNIAPFLRPTNQEDLDPSQLYPEYLSLATNQLEPVKAQTFEPTLLSPYDISLQDQLNEVDSQVRAATRQLGSNPAAAAQIFASAEQAKNRIRGEQFRMNQANKSQIYNQNTEKMNQAKLQNLQILDTQAVRQAQAKSNTKEQALEAIKSIAAKTAQNKLQNRELGIYENMYNYRFGPKGQAYNVNAPAQFNIPEGVGIDNLSDTDKSRIKDYYEKIVSRDKTGSVTGSKEKTSSSKTSRNGSIVKSLKTL